MNETTVKSSKDERNIHIRRKPTSAEKHFKCSCGKSYLCNESLYIHRKIKHPEEQDIRQFLVPEKKIINVQNRQKENDVKPVEINNDTFSMMTKSAFLNFFRTIKDLADENKEVLSLFLTERHGYTALNKGLLDTGIQAHLEYFLKAFRLHENIPEISHSVIPTNFRSGIQQGKSIHISSPLHQLEQESSQQSWQIQQGSSIHISSLPLMQQSQQQFHHHQPYHFPQLDINESNEFERHFNMHEQHESMGVSLDLGDRIAENSIQFPQQIHDFNNGNEQHKLLDDNAFIITEKPETTPQYYKNFFTIAKEMVKPMTKIFALEMCYVFNKLIMLSTMQQNQTIQEYQVNNQREILKLIEDNPEVFPKFTSLSQLNRKTFIEKLMFHLARLFSA